MGQVDGRFSFLRQEMDRQQIKTLKAISCVYLISDTRGGLMKIGRTKDLRSRFLGLQNSGPTDLQIFDYVRTKETTEIEKIFHNFFRMERLHGEWFALTSFEDRTWAAFLCISGNYFSGCYDE